MSDITQQQQPDHRPQTNNQKPRRDVFDTYARDWKILIDTCSLLEDSADAFWMKMVPYLQRYQNYIIVPQRCWQEVEKHSHSKKDPELAASAVHALQTLQRLKNAGYIHVHGEDTDNFADNVFQTVFIKFRMKYKLLLITQDNHLAQDILNMNNLTSVQANPIHVRRLGRNGALINFAWAADILTKDSPGIQPRSQQWQNRKNSQSQAQNRSQGGGANRQQSANGPQNQPRQQNQNRNRTQAGPQNNNQPQQRRQQSQAQSQPQKAQPQGQSSQRAQRPRPQPQQASAQSRERPAEVPVRKDPAVPFAVYTQVSSLPDHQLHPASIPQENSTVLTDFGPIHLREAVARGGEGVIYNTDTPYVAKIYHEANNTARKFEKIQRMLSHKLKCEGICFPLAALYNEQHQFVGYLMPRASGVEIQRSIFIKPRFLKLFPQWKKRDLVELCLTVLQKIRYLHEHNVIMGDINPANILVVSPKEVWFVDTDSYQVEDLPCPVGTINFTAPEIQRRSFSTFLRTQGNENFAVATLLFMLMLPGKPPYSQQGGGDPAENIISMDFSYPFEDNTNHKTPDGPWRYIWSHLLYELKKDFYHTFRREGEYAAENKRLDVHAWIAVFTKYLELLDNGTLGRNDPMSEELFPVRHKKNPKITYAVCRICGLEKPADSMQDGICPECLFKKGDVLVCKRCGREFLFDNFHKLIKKGRPFDYCRDCSEAMRRVALRQTCVDCGRVFDITQGELEHLQSRGMSAPKRCKDCRQRRKNGQGPAAPQYQQQQYRQPQPQQYQQPQHQQPQYQQNYQQQTYQQQQQRSSQTQVPPQPERKKGCYLTTAVCEYLGKPDNCQELQTLRHFRDGWLSEQPEGKALIERYYDTAPAIVRAMKASPQYAQYCSRLWEEYIQPCLRFIAAGDNKSCKEHYVAMVHFMQHLLPAQAEHNHKQHQDQK